MPALSDILVYSKRRRLVLDVEIKEGTEPTPQDAADSRRILLSHDLLYDAPFFLLAYPTRLFLWRQEDAADQLPSYSASTAPIFDGYARPSADSARDLNNGDLEIVIYFWLCELAMEARPPRGESEPERMLVESGLYDQIRRGDVRYDLDT